MKTLGGFSKPPTWTGNYITRITDKVMLHTIHVNTVSNTKYKATWYYRGKHLKKTMSGTSKTSNKARLRFVCDKKKINNIHGMKATRIEFTSHQHRSANYTTNIKPGLQGYMKNLFNLSIMAQGEVIHYEKPHDINNVNYTSHIYGVANPYTFLFKTTGVENTDTYAPLFFSSVNVVHEKHRQQIFSSMTVNSQRLNKNMDALQDALSPICSDDNLEVHVLFNRICCILGERKEAFLTTGEKIALIMLTEEFYMDNGIAHRDDESHWLGYEQHIMCKFFNYESQFTMDENKMLGQYELKNPEFLHIAPNLCSRSEARGGPTGQAIVTNHVKYLHATGKYKSLCELSEYLYMYAKEQSADIRNDIAPLLSSREAREHGKFSRGYRRSLRKYIKKQRQSKGFAFCDRES